MRVCLFIRSLEVAGAERQLTLLAEGLHERGHDVLVVSLYDGGPLGDRLRRAGIEVQDLGKSGTWDVAGPVRRLAGILRRRETDVLYAYMDGANILGTLASSVVPAKLVFGFRASDMRTSLYGPLATTTFWTERALFPLADGAIANSHAGVEHRAEHSFPAERIQVVPNGIDTDRFSPGGDPPEPLVGDRRDPGTPLLGHVGRIDPKKGHPTMIRALAELVDRGRPVHVAFVGTGSTPLRDDADALAHRLGVDDRITWVGFREDMPAVYDEIDLLVSSSAFGEGFPNVIGEAMACGTPCVVTDVGDSARIVDDTGRVVAPESPAELADGIESMLEDLEDRGPELAKRARQRIVEEFSVDRMVERTEAILEETVR